MDKKMLLEKKTHLEYISSNQESTSTSSLMWEDYTHSMLEPSLTEKTEINCSSDSDEYSDENTVNLL